MSAAQMGLEESIGKFQELIDESKHKDVENDQLRQVVAEMQEELAAERKKNKVFAEYEDIIMDPNAGKEYQKVIIRSGAVFKSLRLRCQQLHGNHKPLTLNVVAENCLAYATSRAGWARVVKEKYSDRVKEREEELSDA